MPSVIGNATRPTHKTCKFYKHYKHDTPNPFANVIKENYIEQVLKR